MAKKKSLYVFVCAVCVLAGISSHPANAAIKFDPVVYAAASL